MDYNIQAQLNLNTAASRVPEVLDMGFLESLGRLTDRSDNHILEAQPNLFRFYAIKIEEGTPQPPPIQVIYRMQTTPIPGTDFFGIEIFEENTASPPVSNLVYTANPYRFESANIFRYFSAGKTQITDPANFENIRYVEVNLVFVEPAAGRGNDLLRYPITFWRYFKNLYIRDFSLS
jgi:hypothetical protein